MSLLEIARKIMPLRAPSADPDSTQFGTIPYQIVDGQPVFLMITSRRSANWVFPKGWLIKGMGPADTAAQETFEEAGVRGVVESDPIGVYLNPANNDPASLLKVELFPLLVTEQVDEWPEQAQRFRHWTLLPQLRSLIASKQAGRIAMELNRRLLQQESAAGQ